MSEDNIDQEFREIYRFLLGWIVAFAIIIIVAGSVLGIIDMSIECREQTFHNCVERVRSYNLNDVDESILMHQNCLFVYKNTLIDLSCYDELSVQGPSALQENG